MSATGNVGSSALIVAFVHSFFSSSSAVGGVGGKTNLISFASDENEVGNGDDEEGGGGGGGGDNGIDAAAGFSVSVLKEGVEGGGDCVEARLDDGDDANNGEDDAGLGGRTDLEEVEDGTRTLLENSGKLGIVEVGFTSGGVGGGDGCCCCCCTCRGRYWF